MSRHLRILVVEDDAQGQRMLDVVLRHSGHETIFATNGDEAVKIVKRQQCDLVLMDVQMPVMDGIEATRKIREWESRGLHLPIIGITASSDERVNNYLQVGMDHVIFKPFDLDQLNEVIEAVAEHREIPRLEVTETPVFPTLELPILDVQGAIKRLAGNSENYLALLDEFADSLPERFQALTQDFTSGNWHDLSERAHNLKGLCASLGAMRLSRNFLELEEQLKLGWYGDIEEKINQIGDGIHILKSRMLELSKHPYDPARTI